MSGRESSGIMVRAGSRSARSAAPGPRGARCLVRWIFALATLSALIFVSAWPSRAQSQSTASKSATVGATTSAKVAAVDTATVTQAATPKPVASPTAPVRQSAPKGQQEGIKVHGHWVIEVINPDGKRASRTEFENSLVGPNVLAELLSGNDSMGAWVIQFNGTPSSPCSTNPNGCYIEQVGATALNGQVNCSAIVGPASPQPSCYATLTESLGAGAAQLTLSGQAYVDTPTLINGLQTIAYTCSVGSITSTTIAPATVSPSTCLATVGYGPPDNASFTAVTLPAQGSGQCGGANQPSCAVNVNAGQTIALVVTISFQ